MSDYHIQSGNKTLTLTKEHIGPYIPEVSLDAFQMKFLYEVEVNLKAVFWVMASCDEQGAIET